MALFDFPDANATSEQRIVTVGPMQRLFFMNSPFVARQARVLAARLAGKGRIIAVATVGANWYLTTNVKMQFNAERSVFDGDSNGRRPAEHGVLVRLQLNY